MKIQQENLPYRPITIKLDKQHEAVAFFGIIDKIDSMLIGHFDANERGVLHKLSNAVTNKEVVF